MVSKITDKDCKINVFCLSCVNCGASFHLDGFGTSFVVYTRFTESRFPFKFIYHVAFWNYPEVIGWSYRVNEAARRFDTLIAERACK